MPWPAERQSQFAAALADTGAPLGLGPEGEQRFAIYRNNVFHGLSGALAQRFPVIEALLGAGSFQALARQFIAAHPPRSPLLFAWGDALPTYLGEVPALAGYPFLADVARLEWARGLAFHAEDARPVAAEMLAAAAQRADTVRLRLHPSCQVLASRHAAFSIWAAHQPGGSLAGLDVMRPEITLILRDPADRIVTEPLTPGDGAMLAALASGDSLLDALTRAGAGHDPAPLLRRLARHGAITAIQGVPA